MMMMMMMMSENNTTPPPKRERKKERKKEKRLPQKRMRDLSKRLGVSRRSRLSSLVFFCGVLLSPPSLLKKEKERQKVTFLGFQKDTI